MKVVGLTGQTGAGKSTVCQELEKLGYFHIDADAVAHTLTQSGSPLIPSLCKAFGDDILLNDGSVDRKRLAQKAFASPESTLLLNSLTHPEITKIIRGIIKRKEAENIIGVLIDAIALFESGENKLCDFTVAVVAPEEIRLKRIMKRDNISRESALMRIKAQKSEDFYRANADYIIDNSGTLELNDEIKRIFCNEQAEK